MHHLKKSSMCFGFCLFFLLVGCSTSGLVKTYEGPVLTPSELGKLTTSEGIFLISVNGQSITRYIINNPNYALKAGKNLIVFQYESVWGKAKKGANGARSESVISEPKEVLLDVGAGKAYTFSYLRPSNVREARKFADNVQVSVYDKANNLVAESQKLAYHAGLMPPSAMGGVVDDSGKVKSGKALDILKLTWSTATAEEKKAFLAWAFKE